MKKKFTEHAKDAQWMRGKRAKETAEEKCIKHAWIAHQISETKEKKQRTECAKNVNNQNDHGKTNSYGKVKRTNKKCP